MAIQQSNITVTALEKHGNIHGKSATTMMRMMVNKMATHDNNYCNKEEKMAQIMAQTMSTMKAKRHANSSIGTKKTTAEMQIHDENKMATTTDQWQQQLQLNLP